MNKFYDFLLRLKRWPLFLLVFIPPFLVGMVMLYHIMKQYIIGVMELVNSGQDPANGMSSLISGVYEPMYDYMPFIGLTSIMAVMWTWAIADGARRFLPEGVTIKINLFRIASLIPVLYIVFFMSTYLKYSLELTTRMMELSQLMVQDESYVGEYFQVWGQTMLLSWGNIIVFSGIAIYSAFIPARVLRSAELGRKAKIKECIEAMFLIWFNFVGIWIIQPKLNRLIDPVVEDELEMP